MYVCACECLHTYYGCCLALPLLFLFASVVFVASSFAYKLFTASLDLRVCVYVCCVFHSIQIRIKKIEAGGKKEEEAANFVG